MNPLYRSLASNAGADAIKRQPVRPAVQRRNERILHRRRPPRAGFVVKSPRPGDSYCTKKSSDHTNGRRSRGLRQCKVLGPNRTKCFHVKHFWNCSKLRQHGRFVGFQAAAACCRTCLAAVGAPAPLGIENARRSHPAQRRDPNNRSKRDRCKQTGENGSPRKSPCKHARACASEPIARAVGNIVCHDAYPPQQEAGPVSPERSAWTGGHGTEP